VIAMSDRLTLIEDNKDRRYKIWRSSEIVDNRDEFIRQIESSRNSLMSIYPDIDSTWGYNVYNLFAISAGYEMFHNLYKDLQFIVRDYLQTDDPLWMQSWANYHYENDILDWHAHFGWACHGYISIDPKDTVTMFEGFEIANEVGNIYIGPPEVQHKVYVREPYDGHRITCGYDIAGKDILLDMQERNAINISFMPI
jgi:hypothetical protein